MSQKVGCPLIRKREIEREIESFTRKLLRSSELYLPFIARKEDFLLPLFQKECQLQCTAVVLQDA